MVLNHIFRLTLCLATLLMLGCASQPPAPAAVTLPIQQSARGVEIMLPESVLFETGKAELNVRASEGYFDKIAQLLTTKTDKKILIEGHTDATGNAAVNQKLSEQRAQVVLDALKVRGVPEARMSTKGEASRRPVAPNDLEAGRRLNRRTEIVILEENSANLMRGEPANAFEDAAERIRRILEQGSAQ